MEAKKKILENIKKERRYVRGEHRSFYLICWIWQRGKKGGGYGAVRVGKKMIAAHRLSYLLFKGPIPDGMMIRHKCDNPSCVNPEHLVVGTAKENTRDMMARGRWRSHIYETRRVGGVLRRVRGMPAHHLSKKAEVGEIIGKT